MSPGRPRGGISAAAGFLAAVILVVPALAAPGDLDPGFDGDGKVTASFGSDHDSAQSVALQSDGKIVAAGGTSTSFALGRFHAAGQPDQTFSGDGKLTTLIGDHSRAYDVAIQGDGKLVLAGYTSSGSASGTDFAAVRYAPSDGSPDGGFGTGGVQTTDFGPNRTDEAYAAGFQSGTLAGRIVLAGSSDGDIALARYNADGSLDDGTASDTSTSDSFGTSGRVLTATAGGSAGMGGRDLAVLPNNKLVVAGGATETTSGPDFVVARYESGGQPDTGFDTDGQQTTPVGPDQAYDFAEAVAVQPDGKVVAAGYSEGSSALEFRWALVRYNENGSVDTSFGTNGRVVTEWAKGFGDRAYDVTVQPDGKIVAAGTVTTPSGYAFGVARYNADGGLDSSFGTGGKATTFAGSENGASGVALQPDGKIVLAGQVDTSTSTTPGSESYDFGLARFQATGEPAGDGDGTGEGDDEVVIADDFKFERDSVFERVQIGGSRLRATRRGKVPIRLTCIDPGGCRDGLVQMESTQRVDVSARRRRRRLALGTVGFDLAAGQSAVVRMRLSRRNFGILKRRRRIRVSTTVRATDAAGNSLPTRKLQTLLAPKRR